MVGSEEAEGEIGHSVIQPVPSPELFPRMLLPSATRFSRGWKRSTLSIETHRGLLMR